MADWLRSDGEAATRRVRIVDVVGAVGLAPLHWLERARGWRRRMLVVLYLLVGLVLGSYARRAVSIRDIPDVGDPFDVAAFLETTRVPVEQNAFALYRAATSAVSWKIGVDYTKLLGAVQGPPNEVDDEIRGWFEDSRPALELWRQGTERPDSLPDSIEQAGTLEDNPAVRMVNELQILVYFALMEAARLEAEDDLAGAWAWYRAILRCRSHLSRNGDLRQREFLGVLIPYSVVQPRVLAWVNDPRVDPPLLRQALSDVGDAAAMAAPMRDAYKVEYIVAMKRLDNLDTLMANHPAFPQERGRWLRIAQYFQHEPERARRIVRLFFANHLAQADRPPHMQPKRLNIHGAAGGLIWVFDDDPTAPPALPATELRRRIPTSSPALLVLSATDSIGFPVPSGDPTHGALRLAIAERLYLAEHGREPERNADLVNAGYLDRLPDGYEDAEDVATEPGESP